MYRLLLVSDREEIRDFYYGFSEWESHGFERPVICKTASEGSEQLGHNRFDAVSTLLSIHEGQNFFKTLSKHQEIIGIEAARTESRLRSELSRARRKLSAKDSARRMKQLDDFTQVMSWEFVYEILRGEPVSKETMDERFQTLKMRSVDPARPIAVSSFRLPQGDYFLAEVWRYGKERLEKALKNVFEVEDDGVIYALLMINPHHMRLMGLPTRDMNEDEIYEHMLFHMQRCCETVEEYFELKVDIRRVVRYDSLYALGRENMGISN